MSDAPAVPTLLTEQHITKQFMLPAGALRQDRYAGTGLPYVRIGRRIRYDAEQVAGYLREHTVTPDSATAPAT